MSSGCRRRLANLVRIHVVFLSTQASLGSWRVWTLLVETLRKDCSVCFSSTSSEWCWLGTISHGEQLTMLRAKLAWYGWIDGNLKLFSFIFIVVRC